MPSGFEQPTTVAHLLQHPSSKDKLRAMTTHTALNIIVMFPKFAVAYGCYLFAARLATGKFLLVRRNLQGTDAEAQPPDAPLLVLT